MCKSALIDAASFPNCTIYTLINRVLEVQLLPILTDTCDSVFFLSPVLMGVLIVHLCGCVGA